MNKKAQVIDLDVLMVPGFWILVAFAWSATILGFYGSSLWGGVTEAGVSMGFPWYIKLAILFGELVACYLITWKMSG